MLNKFVRLVAIASFGGLISMQAAGVYAATVCSSTSTAADHLNNDAANGDPGYCFATPNVLELTFYEFGLCNSAASPTSKDNCKAVFKDVSGTRLNVSKDAVADLIKETSLEEGTYTHGYLIVGNGTKIKLSFEFSTARTDDTGGSGVYCYTDGRSINTSNSIMSCGTSPAPAASAETMGLGDDCGANYNNTALGYPFTKPSGAIVRTDLWMVDSAYALSRGCPTDHAFFAVQPLAAPVNVTASTRRLDIGISLSGAVSMGFPGNALGEGPNDAMFNGLQFVIEAE